MSFAQVGNNAGGSSMSLFMRDESRKSLEFSAKFTEKLVSMQFASKLTMKESLFGPNYTASFAVNFFETNSIVTFAENSVDSLLVSSLCIVSFLCIKDRACLAGERDCRPSDCSATACAC